MTNRLNQFVVLAGILFFTACTDSSDRGTTKETSTEVKTTTAPAKDTVKKTTISIGPDGAGVKSKTTDVQVNKTGVKVGTKDVQVDVKSGK